MAPEETDAPGEYDTLRVTVDDETGVARVTLDRPDRMNAVSVALLEDLDRALDTLDEGVRAVLVTGAGDQAFSAGADLGEIVESDAVDAVELSRLGQRVFGRLRELDQPVLAAIDGFCLGGGMELATCADLRVASGRSRFGQTEHDLGLLPGWGGTQRLQRLIGQARAKEVILTAEQFDAETMREYGFLCEVVPADDLEERAEELAADLAAGPPVAQRFTKRAMHGGEDDLAAGLELEAQAFGHVVDTEDVTEGVAAFREDRDPEFEGQ